MSVEIIFEAHATSVDNERHVATGWLDGALSDLGKNQAKELGERRADADVVFVSDLGRAVETSEIAFAGRDVPVRRDARLRECNYGELNGAPLAQIDEERPKRIDTPFPHGESYRQCVERVQAFLKELTPEFDGKQVVVIGHRATLYALEHLLKGTTLEQLINEPLPPWEPGWRYVLDAS